MNFDDLLVVIPARFRSRRLPGKPLVDIAGIPMVVRTAERCFEVIPRDRVLVATDDERIVEACEARGIRVEMTRDDHPTGTDRVAEIASRFPASIYVNVQGDEPVFNPDDILRIIEESRKDPSKTYIGYCAMTPEQWGDSKYIKLLFGLDRRLIYIGRAQVPGSHDGRFTVAYRQVCVYAYPADALAAFASSGGRTPLEEIEDCEVVRFLELGLPVQVVELSADSMSVDRPEDVIKVEEFLARRAAT
jgi:3-deoxy-manno-octulosonate cytidylyltransferase (CMP-KDO synthetase)